MFSWTKKLVFRVSRSLVTITTLGRLEDFKDGSRVTPSLPPIAHDGFHHWVEGGKVETSLLH